MNNSFLNISEINKVGFRSVGKNVFISRFASIYNPNKISIGSNVRIDDFCILSGDINIGSYVHISAYSALYGSKGIVVEDFSGLSPRATIFSAIDDFSGEFLINPMVPKEITNVKGGLVILSKFCQIGAHSVVLPNIKIEIGAVVGAQSLVNKNLKEWGIYAGIPVKYIKGRSRKLLEKYSSYFN